MTTYLCWRESASLDQDLDDEKEESEPDEEPAEEVEREDQDGQQQVVLDILQLLSQHAIVQMLELNTELELVQRTSSVGIIFTFGY